MTDEKSKEFKKYLDRIIKEKLKLHDGSYDKASLLKYLENDGAFDYSTWIADLVSVKMDGYFPQSRSEIELVEFLCFELLYKQNIKNLVDCEHPVIIEAFRYLKISESHIDQIIFDIKNFHDEKLAYFALFEEEIKSNNSQTMFASIHHKIDVMTQDSSQGTVVSHSAKMTNPACKYPRLYVHATEKCDGYLRTGNIEVEFDLHINATKLVVFKLLCLTVQGETFFELVKEESINTISTAFRANEAQVRSWIDNLNVCINARDMRSHSAIKQIYFPVNNSGYHQLSLLQPSGLVFKLKQRLDYLNNRSTESYSGKKAKKSNEFHKTGFSFVPNLTETKHGGDHPKNISGLNNKYQSYYLLPSLPPTIKKRDIHFPTANFFSQSISYYHCRELFLGYHQLISSKRNTIEIRQAIDSYYQAIFDVVIARMWRVRAMSNSDYIKDSSRLKKAQLIWLSDQYAEQRLKEDNWLDEICDEIARFIIRGYKTILGNKAIEFSDHEFNGIKDQIVKHKEALR